MRNHAKVMHFGQPFCVDHLNLRLAVILMEVLILRSKEPGHGG